MSEFVRRSVLRPGPAEAPPPRAPVAGSRPARSEPHDPVRASAELAVFEERRRLALELHGTVAAMLFTLNAGIRALGDEVSLCAPRALIGARLRELEQQASAVSAALRTSLRGLHSAPEGLSLGITLREDVRAFAERTGVRTQVLVLTDLPPLGASRVRPLCAAVREALLNVEKHAGASLVVVSVFADDHAVTVTVSDDGAGLPPQGVRESGLGLAAMADLLERIGGRLRVDGFDEGGVSVRVRVPC